MEQRMIYRTVISITALASLAFAQPQWRVLPIRSQQEYEQGLAGGEGEQYPHSLSRSYYNPEHIYLGHDVGGAWRSEDGGATWYKCLDKGLFLPVCLGIAVDPANPDIAFITVDNSFNWMAVAAEGVYRTTDGGENWTRVLAEATNYTSSDHRMFQETIAHDPTTADSTTPASRWYAAIHNGGLYRSDNGGVTWSSSPVSSLVGHASVHVVRPHPTDARTVYVGTSQGLFRSDSLGRNLAAVGNLPASEVTSVFVNPRNPAEVLAVVENVGLYRSTNSATTFVQVRAHNSAHVFVNPNYPSSMFLISLSGTSYSTINGGTTWAALPNATTFPGLGRETGWRRSWDGVFCAVVPNPSDSLEAVAHSRSTLFKTTDAGRTIRESATGWTGNAWGWYNSAAAFHPGDPGRIALFLLRCRHAADTQRGQLV